RDLLRTAPQSILVFFAVLSGLLNENRKPTLQRLEERIRRFPPQRRHDDIRLVRSAGTSDEEQPAADGQKRLKGGQHAFFEADGADGEDVEGFAQLRAGEQLFDPGCFDLRVGQVQLADGLAEERGLARLDLDHQKRDVRRGQLHWDRWRTAARPDVHLTDGRPGWEVAGGD